MKITGTRPWWRTLWKTPSRKPFRPEGIALGATVTARVWDESQKAAITITGQVWSRSHYAKCWWVVTPDQRAFNVHETELQVLGQCVEIPLPLAA